jgi:FtsH-binding integral membrane protein
MAVSSYNYSSSYDQRMAIDASASERLAFIRRTYLHVAGATIAFAIMLAALVNFVPDQVMISIFGRGMVGMLVIFFGFMAATWAAARMAQADMPVSMQYLGLLLYTAAEAFFFWPIIWLCLNRLGYEGILGQAVVLTLALAVGLTASVFITKKDFSFMGRALVIMSFVAFGVIIAAMLFGFSLGLWFSLAMIALMCGVILYQTSNVLHHYQTNQHVAAALAIFSAIATLFFYILRALMQSRD